MWYKRPKNIQIIGFFGFSFGQPLFSGQAAKRSRIAPQRHGLDTTSGHEHAEAKQEHAEAGHKYNALAVQSVPRLVVSVRVRALR